jgi:hypothetical protein
MSWKIFFGLMFFIFVALLLSLYWFMPYPKTEFIGITNGYENSNFTLNSGDSMQFYPNMRFSSPRISYDIYDCPLQKEDDMLDAFQMLSDVTVLEFYNSEDPDIIVTCQSTEKIEGGMFIAGEGGPTNITKVEDFNVINSGKILLIKESKCQKPNVALHELLHVLGFDHSENPNNIMYYITDCDQTLGEDQIDLINNLYTIPGYPDLSFSDVSAVLNGRHLNTNMSIRNNGFVDSPDARILIYTDDTVVKEVELDPLEIGSGVKIILKNIPVKSFGIDELKFVIESNFNELDKDNNKMVLKVRD